METRRLSSYSLLTICVATTCLILLGSSDSSMVESASVIHHQKRSAVVSPQSNNEIFEECNDGAPCGWEVYEPHTRNLAYYVQSSCKCKARESCVQTDDDLRISAYVYKCRVIPRRRPKPPTASSTGSSASRDADTQNGTDS